MEHWPTHQHDCKRVQLQYKTFFITDDPEGGKNYLSGQIFSRITGDRPKKSHFVVKVVMETSMETIDDVDCLMVFTEDNSIWGNIVEELCLSEVEEIKKKIRIEGHKGAKGFFYAIIPKDGKTKVDGKNVVEIKINSSQIQPIEGW